jgi:hypothetical protein
MDKARIAGEAEHFFEWPDPKCKDTVTLTSCVIFASVIAEMAMTAERERCAKLCDVARDAIWPYHEPEVLNAACTVCENLANRIRGLEA